MPTFGFKVERWDFYKIYADTKEKAVELMQKQIDEDSEACFSHSEIDTKAIFLGAFDDVLDEI